MTTALLKIWSGFCVGVAVQAAERRLGRKPTIGRREKTMGIPKMHSDGAGEFRSQDGEKVMLVTDLIHSCSNDKVAQAATFCIGGVFAERVRAVAQENGVSAGRFVSVVVRDFAQRADEAERAQLAREMAGCDQPILSGLRKVVEKALEGGAQFADDVKGFGLPFLRDGGLSFDAAARLQRAAR